MNTLLEPMTDPTNRCKASEKCVKCAPQELLSAQQRKEMGIKGDNIHMKKSVSLAFDPENPTKMRVVGTHPLNEEMIKNGIKGSNRKQVEHELDRKLENLLHLDKFQNDEEFKKLEKRRIFIKVSDLPEKDQEDLWSQEFHNFLAIAPGWKTSMSTTFRSSANGSNKRRDTKTSLNDTALVGSAPLDMGRAWRKFKCLPSSAIGDIEKYYNQMWRCTSR